MKTRIVFKADQYQQPFKKGDTGYIDGYVRGGDERPYAVVVGDSGDVGLVDTYNIRAITVADVKKPNNCGPKVSDHQWDGGPFPCCLKCNAPLYKLINDGKVVKQFTDGEGR